MTSPTPEDHRKFEADLNAYLMSAEKVPVTAIFSSGNIAVFFGVSPSVVTNWAIRNSEFPRPLRQGSTYGLYDIRKVVQWWIHWNPENGRKGGRLPENWKDYLN